MTQQTHSVAITLQQRCYLMLLQRCCNVAFGNHRNIKMQRCSNVAATSYHD